MNRILACIDASTYANSVIELAAWASVGLGAEVELLHVVQRKDAVASRNDHSGAIGLGIKSELLEELVRIEEESGRLAVEESRVLLEAGIEKLRYTSFPAHQVHLHGGIVETIIEREANADLVIIGKRGASGEFATDHIGSQVERVVRASTKPVLVAPREMPLTPQSVVIAFDNSPAACRAVHYVATSPLFEYLPVHLIMAGTDNNKHRDQLSAAASTLPASPETALLDGKIEMAIGNYMAQHPCAILVMGAYGHSPLRTLIVGSTTTTMIRTVRAPVLLVR